MKVVKNGFTTGLILQFALGPIFFFVVFLAIRRTIQDAFFAIAAITVADYLYILLAIFGVAKLLEKKRLKLRLAVFSSIILISFGIYMIGNGFAPHPSYPEGINSSPGSSFLSAFFLTISSPLTIIFWSGVFIAKSLEYNYIKKELFIFGISAGLATPAFLGLLAAVLFFAKQTIPEIIVLRSNIIAGTLLIVYGIMRFIEYLKKSKPAG